MPTCSRKKMHLGVPAAINYSQSVTLIGCKKSEHICKKSDHATTLVLLFKDVPASQIIEYLKKKYYQFQ